MGKLLSKKVLFAIGALVVVVALVLYGVSAFVGRNARAATNLSTVTVQRGDLQATVLSSGALQPAADVTLSFGSGGTVAEIFVKNGDAVTKGQKLAALDTRDLQFAVDQAQANLTSAQAKYDQVKAGAAPKDIANAQSQLAAAQAKLDSLKAGPSKEDLATAEAQVTSAQAKLHALTAGPSAQDVANAQSQITAAQAKLDALKAGPTAEDVANAQSQIASAQAKLDALKAGPSPEDVANAKSQITSAQAKLDALTAGPTTAELSSAQLKVISAQTNFDKVSSSASLSKQNAEKALDQAGNAVRDAQDQLNEASVINVPRQGQVNIVNPDGTFNSNATLAQIDKYRAALRAEQDAEANMHQAQLALDDARQQEIQSVAAAQATLDDAKRQLADLQSGPAAADLAAAQAAVDQAQNNLAKLQAPPAQADLVQAQAAVDQAKNNLAKLQAPPTQSDLVQAQAAVDQAKNNLAKLQAPPTHDDLVQAQAAVTQAQANLAKVKAGTAAADLAQAQSTVDQAKNNLNDLMAGATTTDLATAQATVDQAKSNLSSAQLKLAQAVLTAPFDGVVADVPVTVGGQIGASAAAIDLLDESSYHVDMNVGESDVSRVKVGQPVNLTFDALPGEVFTGTITYVAPKATVQQGVVSYLATATLDPKAAGSDIKPGMTTTAEAIVQDVPDALMVPNRAIRTEARQKVVYVLDGRNQIRVPVQTGISNDQFTEITGDTPLREGDTLVLNTTTTSTTTQGPGGGGFINFGGGARGR
ncbi:MAG TPA: efflux RND transporter periplasmic adaptor subunit [Chloroflexia bacterium]|jgi:HlyD family secretion protein|nr:efflux RND transporter periplasmic adaptor subunit [Chloroflexia bacterium]